MDLIMWSLQNPVPIIKSSRNGRGNSLGDSDGVVRALLVPQVANQLPVVGAGAHVGAADDVLDSGLQVLVRAPASGVCFLKSQMLATNPVQVLKDPAKPSMDLAGIYSHAWARF